MTQLMTSRYMRAKEASAYLKISPSTLWKWVKDSPSFPQPIRHGRRYTIFDIEKIESHLQKINQINKT